jgi:hypothetical protein
LSPFFSLWLSKALAESLAFFLAYGCCSFILVWKQPQVKMRWGLIPTWLIGSIGLYCLGQFPERRGIIWASVAAMIAASLLIVWAISKRSNAREEGS